MSEIFADSPLSELGLKTQAPKTLAEHDITSVGDLLARSRDQIGELSGMGASRMADIDQALQRLDLRYGMRLNNSGRARPCTACPQCPDCGNPRAQQARNVVTDFLGNACHTGVRTIPPCQTCQDHHRQLLADAAGVQA